MITREQALDHATSYRLAAERILEDSERRARGHWHFTADPYPTWAREADRVAGDYLARADYYDRLASGPAWKRWLA